MMTRKKILFFLLSGICMATTQGKAGTVNLHCVSESTNEYVGDVDGVKTPPDMSYDEKCDLHYQSASPNCGAGCTASVVSSSDADPTGPERAIPAAPAEKNMHTLSSPTSPTEEDRTQTYAPTYQPQEEQRQNFQRSVTQGEGPEIPTDPTRNLKLAPIDREAQE